MQHSVILAAQPYGLGLDETLLPQHLQKLGYATHAVGKVSGVKTIFFVQLRAGVFIKFLVFSRQRAAFVSKSHYFLKSLYFLFSVAPWILSN